MQYFCLLLRILKNRVETRNCDKCKDSDPMFFICYAYRHFQENTFYIKDNFFGLHNTVLNTQVSNKAKWTFMNHLQGVFLWSQSQKLLPGRCQNPRKTQISYFITKGGSNEARPFLFFYEFYLIRGQWPRWQMMACHHYLDPGSGLEDSFLESCVRVGGMPVCV